MLQLFLFASFGLGQVQGDFLQVIEKLSRHGVIKCVAFNNGGTHLAGIILLCHPTPPLCIDIF